MDEFEDFIELFRDLHIVLDVLHSLADIHVTSIDAGVGAFDVVNGFIWKTSAMESNRIQSIVCKRTI